MSRIEWTWILQLCVAIAIAVSIAIFVGTIWAALFVSIDAVYAWRRIRESVGYSKRQEGSKSSWSRTLR
jgi:hypothetical protein